MAFVGDLISFLVRSYHYYKHDDHQFCCTVDWHGRDTKERRRRRRRERGQRVEEKERREAMKRTNKITLSVFNCSSTIYHYTMAHKVQRNVEIFFLLSISTCTIQVNNNGENFSFELSEKSKS